MKSLLSILIWTILCLTTISTVAQPTITADGDLEFCYGESVTLCVELTYQAYLWNTGATTSCITVTEDGEYYVVLIDGSMNIDSSLVLNPTTVTVHSPTPNLIQSGDTIIVTNQFEAYQWYFETVPLIEETDSFLIPPPNSPPCYWVEVTDSFGCTGRSLIVEWNFSCTSSVEDVEEVNPLIFPNPTTGKTRLDFTETVNDLSLKVFNPIGSLIYSRQLDGIQYFDLELPETSGLYFIQLLRSDGTKNNLKVIKK